MLVKDINVLGSGGAPFGVAIIHHGTIIMDGITGILVGDLI